jgi:hypothetical protein
MGVLLHWLTGLVRAERHGILADPLIPGGNPLAGMTSLSLCS